MIVRAISESRLIIREFRSSEWTTGAVLAHCALLRQTALRGQLPRVTTGRENELRPMVFFAPGCRVFRTGAQVAIRGYGIRSMPTTLRARFAVGSYQERGSGAVGNRTYRGPMCPLKRRGRRAVTAYGVCLLPCEGRLRQVRLISGGKARSLSPKFVRE